MWLIGKLGKHSISLNANAGLASKLLFLKDITLSFTIPYETTLVGLSLYNAN